MFHIDLHEVNRIWEEEETKIKEVNILTSVSALLQPVAVIHLDLLWFHFPHIHHEYFFCLFDF